MLTGMDFIQKQLSSVWPGWKITRPLGIGTYGPVYEIIRSDIGSYPSGPDLSCALKVLYIENEEMIDTFVTSISSMIDVMIQMKGHPHIVAIEDYAVLRDTGTCLILIRMEKLVCLSDSIDTGLRPDTQRVIRLGMDISLALAYCEQNNVLHLDIKPGNIFYSETTGFKLGDFGISRAMESICAETSKSGSPPPLYQAPEVFRKEKCGSTADQYSLGIVLYMLMNDYRIPLAGENIERSGDPNLQEACLRRLYGEHFTPPANADEKLGRTILKACSYASRDRYPTARDFYAALEACLNTTSSRKKNTAVKHAMIIAALSSCIVLLSVIIFRILSPSTVQYSVSSVDDRGNDTPETESQTAASSTETIVTETKTETTTEAETTAAKTTGLSPRDEVIQWKDENFGNAVHEFLGISGDLTPADTEPIKELRLLSADITDLSDLQYFPNLQILYISWNNISDLSPAARLHDLRQLKAEGNRISDLSPLQKMRSLERIDLCDNTIDDLSPLKDLTRLKMLDVRRNQVSDISVMSSMTDMKELYLSYNRIEDITPLAGMTKLTYLSASSNFISDISALKDMKDLTVLTLNDNKVTDISVLRNLKKIYHLKIRGNPIEDYSPLDDYPEKNYLER